MRFRIGLLLIGVATLATPVHAQCAGGGGSRGGSVAGAFNPLGGTANAGPGSPLASFAAINAYQSQLAQQRYIIAMQQAALQQAYQQQAYQQMMNQAAPVANERELSDRLDTEQDRTVSVQDVRDASDATPSKPSSRRNATPSRRRSAEAMLTVADRARESGNSNLAVKNYRKILKMLPEEDDINQRALARLQEVTATR